jgi:hypothetical protein
MKQGFTNAVREAGGTVFAVTSEPQTLADEARATWELDFPVVGDPHHEISDTCRGRGWLALFVNERVDGLRRVAGFCSHPKGYFQPGVLAVTRGGRVLYTWRGRPGRHNMGGATERPLPSRVLEKIRAALAAGDAAGDATQDQPDEFDMNGIPWPVFVTILLANGWFLRPKGFALARGGPDDVGARARRALRRLLLFVAAWGAAFVWLPASLVLLALAAWTAIALPGIVQLHREFQVIPETEAG